MDEKTLCEMKLELIVFVAQCDDENVICKLKILLDELVKKELSDSKNHNPD